MKIFVIIDETVAHKSQFFNYQDGGRPPFCIFKASHFKKPIGLGGSICITVPNFIKIGQTVLEMSHLTVSK